MSNACHDTCLDDKTCKQVLDFLVKRAGYASLEFKEEYKRHVPVLTSLASSPGHVSGVYMTGKSVMQIALKGRRKRPDHDMHDLLVQVLDACKSDDVMHFDGEKLEVFVPKGTALESLLVEMDMERQMHED